MQHGIDVGAGCPASLDIGDIERQYLVIGPQMRDQANFFFRQAKVVTVASELPEHGSHSATGTGNQHPPKFCT